MLHANPSVLVIDDDPEFRDSVGRLLRSVGLNAQQFSSVSEFFDAEPRPEGPTCLVVDVRLPGRSGLDLQRELTAANRNLPIIFITAHGDIPMTVRAMKAGAVEFLAKPFRDQDLLDAVQLALERDRARRQQDSEIAVLRERFELLSPREREVVAMVVSGMLNKQIAAQIGTSENTVKVHRSRAMEKMQANSLAELVKMIERLQVPSVRAS
jgi:RNA polymerase sigma factor (sigma-70 family)